MRNNLQNLAFVCLPVGANTEREDRGVKRFGSRNTGNRTANIVVKPQVGHIAREGQTAKVLAGVHGQTPEVGIGRVLGNRAFAVAVAATDRESSTDASAFTEAEVHAEHAAVDIGAVAGITVERIGFVGAVEDISPNTEALLGIQIALDQRVGNQFHRVVGHVVGTGRDRSSNKFLHCLFAATVELIACSIEELVLLTNGVDHYLILAVATGSQNLNGSGNCCILNRAFVKANHNRARITFHRPLEFKEEVRRSDVSRGIVHIYYVPSGKVKRALAQEVVKHNASIRLTTTKRKVCTVAGKNRFT